MSEREILKKLIQAGKDAEVKLETLSKPELRHGDYGGYYESKTDVVIAINMRETKKGLILANKYGELSNVPIKPDTVTIFGNFFDDIERNSKDLTEFEARNGRLYSVKVWIDKYGDLFIKQADGNTVLISSTEVTGFHQKLGRMLATIRRSEK